MKIRDILSAQYQKSERARKKDLEKPPVDSAQQSKKSQGSQGTNDQSVISKTARELQAATQLIRESVSVLKSMPAVRADAVAMAKQRVASGYYNRPEVIDNVAAIISEHLHAESPVSPSDLATDVIANISPTHAEMTKSDLVAIRKQLEKGLYHDSKEIDQVADRIMRFLGEVRDSQ